MDNLTADLVVVPERLVERDPFVVRGREQGGRPKSEFERQLSIEFP